MTPKLAIEILRFATAPLTTMTTDLEPRLVHLINILEDAEKDFQTRKAEELKKELKKTAEEIAQTKLTEEQMSNKVPIFVFELDENVVADVAKRLQRSKKTVQRYLDQLCDAGWMSEDTDSFDRRKKIFKLMYSLSEIRSKIGELNIEKNEETYMNNFKAEGRAWLDKVVPQLAQRSIQIDVNILEMFK